MPTNNAITNQHQLDQLITCIQNGTWNEHSINIDAREISSLTKLFAAFRASRKMRYKLNTLEIFALKADNITISDFENLSTLDMQHGKIKKLSLSNLPYLQNINWYKHLVFFHTQTLGERLQKKKGFQGKIFEKKIKK